MAVRDDFAAGEVLAAADLNDTFAEKLPYSYGTATPSTTTDGFLWYDENDTPPTPKFWDGAAFQNVAAASALQFIHSESFSAVSAVSVNDKFSSTYDAYRLFVRITNVSSNPILQIRMRLSGSDNTGTYIRQSIGSFGGTAFGSNQSLNYGFLGEANSTYDLGWTFADIYGAALTDYTVIRSNYSGKITSNASYLNEIVSIIHEQATAYDGFSLLASTGTMTGDLFLYGYSKA